MWLLYSCLFFLATWEQQKQAFSVDVVTMLAGGYLSSRRQETIFTWSGVSGHTIKCKSNIRRWAATIPLLGGEHVHSIIWPIVIKTIHSRCDCKCQFRHFTGFSEYHLHMGSVVYHGCGSSVYQWIPLQLIDSFQSEKENSISRVEISKISTKERDCLTRYPAEWLIVA